MLLVREALSLDEERFEKLQVNGIGETISGNEAMKLAEFLDNYLSRFPPPGRLLLDGSVTNEPKSYDGEGNDNYSASYAWLVQFREFCRICGGFTVV
jgi:hypothetical protein